MNPYIIVHGVHKNSITNQIEVNYEVIIPRENGESRSRGTGILGAKIEIELQDKEIEHETD